MRYIVKNLTRRPVSILCNSGKSYHLPPKYAHELAGIEIENNEFINKLKSRKVLEVQSADEDKSSTAGRSESKKKASAKSESAEKAKSDK